MLFQLPSQSTKSNVFTIKYEIKIPNEQKNYIFK